jgi:cytochrome P450
MQRDVKLQCGFTLPAGTRVFVPIQSIQRDDRNFPSPMEFRPDRWVKRNVDGMRWEEREPSCDCSTSSSSLPAANRSAFLAFSAGGRSCPGQKFAMQEAVLALSILLRDLKFRSIPGYELITVRGLVQHPKDGMPMTIELRK